MTHRLVCGQSVLAVGTDAEVMAAYGAAVERGVPYRSLTIEAVDVPPPIQILPAPAPVRTALPAPVEVDAPPVYTAPAPVSVGTWTGDGGEVSTLAAERATSDAAALEAQLGIVSAPPVYAAGTRLVAVGRDKLRASHQAWTELPTLHDACRDTYRVVRAEDRRDVALDGRELWSGPGIASDRGSLAIERQAVESGGRAGGLPPGSGGLFAILREEDRERIWNGYGTARPGASGSDWCARTRVGPTGQRAVFAAVSPRYTAFDSDQILSLVASVIPDSCRGEVIYDPETASLTVDGRWHAQDVQDFGAGDYFTLGFRVSTSDSGGGALRIAPVAVRNLSLNLIIIDEAHGTEVRIIHRGTESVIRERLGTALRKIRAAYAPFLRRWHHAEETRWDSLPGVALLSPAQREGLVVRAWAEGIAGLAVPADVEQRTAAERLRAVWDLPTAPTAWGASRDTVADAIVTAYQEEPGFSVASLLNSVTRLHRVPVPLDTARVAERHAGRVLRALVSA